MRGAGRGGGLRKWSQEFLCYLLQEARCKLL